MGRTISHSPLAPALWSFFSLKHVGCVVTGFTVNSNEDKDLRLEESLELSYSRRDTFLALLLRSWMILIFPGLGFSWMQSRGWDSSQSCSKN